MNYLLLFLSVALGFCIALIIKKKKKEAHIPIYLAFSGAFLLSITIFEMLPEVFENPSKKIGVFIMSGILLQLFLEFFSKGAEHGHVHVHPHKSNFPWILFVSISIHALMEGLPITDENNLLMGIIIHKIPIAIILSLFFIEANYSKTTTVLFLFLFSLMTPLGTWIAHNTSILEAYKTEINALVIGILLHVSTTILFESSKNHKFNLSKMSAVMVAIVLAYFL